MTATRDPAALEATPPAAGHQSHEAHQGHHHHHGPADFGRAFLIGITLNVTFVLIEAGYGIVANSMALLADAGHNLSDVFGLVVAWGAASLSKRTPTEHYTYGLRRSSILAALFNAVFLLLAIGAIGYEAIRRFGHPEPVAGQTVMVVAGIGILINGVTAWLFAKGRRGDINIRGAFLHMAADAAVSAGVVAAGLLIVQTGWLWLDPATSLVIVAVILFSTWGLLRDSVAMSLDRVPSNIELAEVEGALASLKGVDRVHDLHIWSVSTTEVAMTCHLTMPGGCPSDDFLHATAEMLRERFGIVHATIQVERDNAELCAQASPETL